jgi:phosphopantothenoylcysteine decarboxylase/phosphopantothenate--cysteine ligase
VKFLITAGPTREPIDPVRYISNRSSGKMGYAIARAALRAGHRVILVSGPVELRAPAGARLETVTTSNEMFNAVHKHIGSSDVAVMCAAVADFKPARIASQKIKKGAALKRIEVKPTRDILSSIAKFRKKVLVVGFAAETKSLHAHARKKLREKNCDVIAANDVSRMNTGLESDDNEITLFFKNGEIRRLAREKKITLAKKLVKIFETLKENR